MSRRRRLLFAWHISSASLLLTSVVAVVLCEGALRAFAVMQLLGAAAACATAFFLGRLWHASWPRTPVDDENDTNSAEATTMAKLVALVLLAMFPLLFELCAFVASRNDIAYADPVTLPLFISLTLFYGVGIAVSTDVFARKAPPPCLFADVEPPDDDDSPETKRRRATFQQIARQLTSALEQLSTPRNTMAATSTKFV